MRPLAIRTFKTWLENYGQASAEGDPQASADLFAQDARYYESPFDEPMTGRDAIHQYWVTGAQDLTAKESTYEILAINDNLGIARWMSKFTVIESGRRFALDCLFVVEFNDEGLCQTFREWWHIREWKDPEGSDRT